jgi:AP-1 complex subunit mu
MSRNYRGDIEMSEIEKFMTLVMEQEDDGKLSPIVQNGELSYIYIKHMNIFCESFLYEKGQRTCNCLVVSMSKKNANAAMILSFLYKCVEVFSSYFKDLEEESVRDNFVVIYELLGNHSLYIINITIRSL